MGLRKKWKPPTLDELMGPVQKASFVLSDTFFWPKFQTVITWNKKPEIVDERGPLGTAYDNYRALFAGRFKPMSDTTRPQQDPREGKTSVTDLVLKDIEERRKQGIAKYGTELKTQNGRKALVDLYQELLDAVFYVRQEIEERKTQPPTQEEIVQKQMRMEQMELFPTVSDILAPGVVVEYTPRARQSRESILEEAQRLVHGDRGKDYGHPIFDMTRSADMLTALLRDKLRTGMRLEAEDIAQAMICVKQSRERNQPKRDNNTDTAGYAEVKQMLKEWRDAHPGEDPRNHF